MNHHKDNKLYKKRITTYIALEHCDFFWCETKDIPVFRELWEEGQTLQDICHYFDRPEEEVLVLMIDQSMKDKIKPRHGGFLGEQGVNSQ